MEALDAFLGSSVFTNFLLFLILISSTSYLRSIQSIISGNIMGNRKMSKINHNEVQSLLNTIKINRPLGSLLLFPLLFQTSTG